MITEYSEELLESQAQEKASLEEHPVFFSSSIKMPILAGASGRSDGDAGSKEKRDPRIQEILLRQNG